MKREKLGENFPGLRHCRTFSVYECLWWNCSKRVVRYPHIFVPIVVSNVNFSWFSSTNIHVSTRDPDILADHNDHNVMSYVGGHLTFDFCRKTVTGFSLRNMNLNYQCIFAQMTVKVGPKHGDVGSLQLGQNIG